MAEDKPALDEAKVLKSMSEFVVPYILDEMAKTVKAGYPEITIFEVINPLTQKPFSVLEAKELIEHQYDTIKSSLSEKSEDPKVLTAMIPMFDGKREADKTKFQQAVKQYLRSVPASKQVLLLNRIQKNTPFLIMDPMRKFHHGFQYGPADLLRFVCEPIQSGEVYRFIKTNAGTRTVIENGHKVVKQLENPFYNPIRYPLPDVMANRILTQLMMGTREFYLRKLDDLAKLLNLIKHKKATKPQKMAGTSKAFKILQEIYEKRNNPVYLSQFVKGQERPMHEYRKSHFIELLEQLSTTKRAHPATLGEQAPETTGVSIVGHELGVVGKASHIRGRGKARRRGSKRKA